MNFFQNQDTKKTSGTVNFIRKRTVKKIQDKYGEELLADFEMIRTRPFYGLTSIAPKYNLTKERLRQIHFILYGEDFGEAMKRKSDAVKKEIGAVGCPYDSRTILANTLNHNSYRFLGAEIEKLFRDICVEKGFHVESSRGTEFDLFVNGLKIEIKSYYKGLHMPHKSKTLYERCSLSINQIKKLPFDYLAFYSKIKEKFYLIPREIIKDTGGTLYIPLIESNYKGAEKRRKIDYSLYLDRWDFLENGQPCSKPQTGDVGW